MSTGAAGSRSSAAGVMPSAWASSSRASSRGLSMPACRSLSAARSIALLTVWVQAAWLAARFACARSSRRFRALASSVSRLSGVAKQIGVDAALVLDGADRAGGQPHADRRAEDIGQQRGILQIGQEAAAGPVVGVADVVAAQHALAGDLAAAGHRGRPRSDREAAGYGGRPGASEP